MKIECTDLPEWIIPVCWEMCGIVKICAATLDDAMEIARDKDGVIPLPDNGIYVDGSWDLCCNSAEEIIHIQHVSS